MNDIITFAHMKSTEEFDFISTILAKMIQWYTKSQYFHTEVIFNGYWYTADVFNNKVIKRKLRPLKSHYDYTYIEITKEESDIIKEFLDDILNEEYDLETIIIKQILHLRYNRKDKLYCTEVGLNCLKKIKKCNYPDDGSITPGEFYNCTAKIGNISNIQQLENLNIYKRY